MQSPLACKGASSKVEDCFSDINIQTLRPSLDKKKVSSKASEVDIAIIFTETIVFLRLKGHLWNAELSNSLLEKDFYQYIFRLIPLINRRIKAFLNLHYYILSLFW